MEVVGDGVLVDLRDRTSLCAKCSREVAEVIDGQRDVGGERSRTALPLSQVSATAIFSRFSSMRSAMRSRISERSATEVLPQAGAAAWAASRARSMSSAVDRATTEHLAVDGRRIFEVLALDRRYPLAADPVLVAALKSSSPSPRCPALRKQSSRLLNVVVRMDVICYTA